MEDINDRIATDILTNTEMRKAIGTLLDEWKEDAPPRKERRQMRRWAKKNDRKDVLMYLNALEGALRNNFGSKKGVLCFAPGALESLEDESPAVARQLYIELQDKCYNLQRDVRDMNNTSVEILEQAAEELYVAKVKENNVLTDKARLEQELAWSQSVMARHATGKVDARVRTALLSMFAGAGKPSVTEVLEIVRTLAPDRVEILPSAWQSAEEMDDHFEATDRLLQLLCKLVTTYADTLKEKGDAQARLVFASGEFSAKESTATGKGQLGALRKFLYKGALDAKISFRDKSLCWSQGKCDTLKNSKTTLFPAF